jgi:hypothetical protein
LSDLNVKEMRMKKALVCGAMIVGLASASAWARVDPFAVVPIRPTTLPPTATTNPTTTTTTTITPITNDVTRPPIITPLRPPLISAIR